MLQQWKLILTNWINCYTDKENSHDQNLNRESLQNIIFHLRENLNLDESKSSLFEAQTIEGFLSEKYPEFKFKDGTVDAKNEDELGLAASLLLFFVCVNSKNLDIKNAMCSNLSANDQEIILKFSKCLMECPVISRGEVEAAITESCGQALAMEMPRKHSVAETPPALRSLHGEVRRLQAALDAERFDRNYLQEELARTNGRLERLVKEKEQHKLDILNLKAKISLCCGEHADAKNTNESSDKTAKLTRQLQQIELALEETQVQLNDVVYERDSYKAKIDELKQDRDKWLAASQQESARLAQLSEELDAERRNTQSLKDLVAELQQHNKLNGIDTSSLECDDPDASGLSFPHNSSVCSEICANVVEVQLGEERAKIVVLTQQIQSLQDQINELNIKSDNDKKSLETVIAQRENDIFNLKHRINEEIEDKNYLKAHCNSEITKLNNEINELDQKYKDYKEHSNSITEKKIQEIQTLQEEKLSLIQSLNSETTKLENKIKQLQDELDSERQTRSNMREGYENHMMKLNEKVLNRNNELVELQNSIFEKGEKIETLQMELKQEKEVMDKLKQEYNDLNGQKNLVESELQLKSDEVTSLHVKMQQNNTIIEDMKTEIDEQKTTLSKLNEHIKLLESAKEQMFDEIKNRDVKIEETLVNVNHMTELFNNEKAKLLQEVDEKNAIINSLQTQLQNEITYKVGLQNELTHEQIANKALKEELDKINGEVTKYLSEIEDKDRTINSMDLFIQEEKKNINVANEKVRQLTQELNQKNDIIQLLKNELDSVSKSLQDEIQNNEVAQNKLLSETTEREVLVKQLELLTNEKILVENELAIKCENVNQLSDSLAQLLDENTNLIHSIEQKFKEVSRLKTIVDQMQQTVEHMDVKIKEKEMIFHKLTSNMDIIHRLSLTLQKTEHLNDDLITKLKGEISLTDKLREEIELLLLIIDEKTERVKELENNLKEANQTNIEMSAQKDSVINEFQYKLEMSMTSYEKLTKEFTKYKEISNQTIQSLKKENEQLQFTIEEDNSSHEIMLCEKDKNIDELEQKLKEAIAKLEDITRHSDGIKCTLKEKENQIAVLNGVVLNLEQKGHQVEQEKNELVTKIVEMEEILATKEEKLNTIVIEKENIISENKNLLTERDTILEEKALLTKELAEELFNKKNIEHEKNVLLSEKQDLLKEKATLVEKLDTVLLNEVTIKNNVEEQVNNMKQKLTAEISKNETLLQEKECLTQYLNEEIFLKKITEEEKGNIITEKLTLEQKLVDREQELITVNNDIEILKQNIIKDNETLVLLKQEIENMGKEMVNQKSRENTLLEENQCLLNNIDQLKIELQKINTVQDVLKQEKESLEIAINTEKSVRDELETEKNNLSLKLQTELENKVEENQTLHEEYDKLTKKYEDLKQTQEDLVKQKEFVIQDMKSANEILRTEKESVHKTLHAEKNMRDHAQSEKKALKAKFELELIDKEENIATLSKEIEKLNASLAEEKLRLESVMSERDVAISEKEQLMLNITTEKDEKEKCSQEMERLNAILAEDQLKLESLISEKDLIVSEKENLVVLLNQEKCAKDGLERQLQTEISRLQQAVQENKFEQTKQSESYSTSMNSKIKDIQTLQEENKSLHNDLNDVKVQLEVKVHSLQEKLVDNELLTDKLKKSYDSQIDNLNVMITKLTNYMREKTIEIETLRKEKEQLQGTVNNKCEVIKTLEEEIKIEKENVDKLITDFESERQVLKNMVTVTESVMEDQKTSLNETIAEHLKTIGDLQEKNTEYKNSIKISEMKLKSNDLVNTSLLTLLRLERKVKEEVEKESETVREYLDELISHICKERNINMSAISALEFQEKALFGDCEKMKNDLDNIQKDYEDVKTSNNSLQNDLQAQGAMLTKVLDEKVKVENLLQEKENDCSKLQLQVKELKSNISDFIIEKSILEQEKEMCSAKVEEMKLQLNAMEGKCAEDVSRLVAEKQELLKKIEDNKTVITDFEQRTKLMYEENQRLRDNREKEALVYTNKCSELEEYLHNTQKELEKRANENLELNNLMEQLHTKIDLYDTIISTVSKELADEKAAKEKFEREVEMQKSIVNEMKNNMEIQALRTENEQLIRAIGQKEALSALCQEAADKFGDQLDLRDHQVDTDSHSSDNKTITDLEKIIHDKNRTITTLQTDITYMKTLVAESETKLLDVTRELDVTKENCQQLSSQLKKIVYQKNEDIAELKKQVNKMSATENRATQIIKVSAKYQAMILKRIAEIKSNTVLKELTNFGNDNEVRRSLAGSVTMEDLENFLETTDRHLKRCAEKQISLQKERDRLNEVNRINESEIINMRKFLTELSVSFQTFNSLKDLYGQRLSRVISVQRTVRREILSLDGRINDSAMCKLERGYGAAMQDLAECTMNLERWVERCISRTVSVEKIKQAFTSDNERLSLSSPTFQNTGLEIQLEELEKLFQKLLEEVARAVKGEGAKDELATTLIEVRAEYEDKLNRMKAKMKDLFNEQMAVLKSKQREDIALLERELQKTRDRMEESKRAYENHIKDLTRELWTMSEKFLVKNDEAQWLKRKQQSGSLMSLQHVHSSGLVSHHELPSRPSDAHSLRSLPVNDNQPKPKREGRGLHMSDEEGELFDNRYLKELATPRRAGPRLSELKWRNSLCPPHLKSSYPAETQFVPVLDEDDIKSQAGSLSVSRQRKEVGITAYKKPGPPTPSKQAGRLSATDSELRESLRVESEPTHERSERKTTPGRLRSFLRLNRNDNNEGTPRARRLSNIFRKNK